MAREWIIEKIVNGKKCRIYYAEWEYIGGSKMQSSRVEYLNETIKNDNWIFNKNQGENCGKSQK